MCNRRFRSIFAQWAAAALDTLRSEKSWFFYPVLVNLNLPVPLAAKQGCLLRQQQALDRCLYTAAVSALSTNERSVAPTARSEREVLFAAASAVESRIAF